MNQSLEDYERTIIEAMRLETRRDNPVLDAYRLVRFVASGGREVALVHDRYANTFTSWHLFPFDERASELLNCEDNEQIFIETLLDGSSEPDR